MNSSPNANGIYTAYLSGAAGNAFAMFILKDGVIAGGDAGGGLYDGNYALDAEAASWTGTITFVLPPGGTTITGQIATDAPLKMNVPIKLPLDFTGENYVRIETPTGPLNARFVLIRNV